MTFFISVFAVQLHIVHMHSSYQVICLILCTKAFEHTWLRKLIPQAHASSIIFAEHPGNAIHCVRNVIAFTIPPSENVRVFNQIQECVQHVCFFFKHKAVVKLCCNLSCSLHTHVTWRYSQGNNLIQPIHVY